MTRKYAPKMDSRAWGCDWGGDLFSSMQSLCPAPNETGMVPHTSILSSEEIQKFKVIFDYVVSYKAVWDTCSHISKDKNK